MVTKIYPPGERHPVVRRAGKAVTGIARIVKRNTENSIALALRVLVKSLWSAADFVSRKSHNNSPSRHALPHIRHSYPVCQGVSVKNFTKMKNKCCSLGTSVAEATFLKIYLALQSTYSIFGKIYRHLKSRIEFLRGSR